MISIYDNTPVRLEPHAVNESNCLKKINTWKENKTNLNTKFQDHIQSRKKMKWRTEAIFQKRKIFNDLNEDIDDYNNNNN